MSVLGGKIPLTDDSTKGLSGEAVNLGPPCVCACQKITLIPVRVRWSNSGNAQNNPVCTKSVRVFKMLKLDTVQKRKNKKKVSVFIMMKLDTLQKKTKCASLQNVQAGH